MITLKYEVPRVIKFMETERVVMTREGRIGNYCLMVMKFLCNEKFQTQKMVIIEQLRKCN